MQDQMRNIQLKKKKNSKNILMFVQELYQYYINIFYFYF